MTVRQYSTIVGMWSPTLLTSVDDVARRLEVDDATLLWLSEPEGARSVDGVSGNYIVKLIQKRHGGQRLLLAPKPRLKAAQTKILRELLDQLAPHPAAHGFRLKHSIVTNARHHVGKQVVVNCDLQDFFPSIGFPRICGLLIALGYKEDVARLLAFLCTTRLPRTRRRVLPQGAPTSPALSNLISYTLDIRLTALAKRLGFEYTRYADDLTFSGDRVLVGALLKRVRQIITDEGFRLNERKVRTRRRSACQRVTGIVVNRQLSVARSERRRVRAILHRARQSGLAAQDREGLDHFVNHLRGRIAFVSQVNPTQGEPLERAFLAVRPER